MILNAQPSQIEKECSNHLITDQFSLIWRKLRHDEMLLFWKKVPPSQVKKEVFYMVYSLFAFFLKPFCALLSHTSIKIKKNRARIRHWDIHLLPSLDRGSSSPPCPDGLCLLRHWWKKKTAYLVSIFFKVLASIYTQKWISLRTLPNSP